jgi:hypothetical protein
MTTVSSELIVERLELTMAARPGFEPPLRAILGLSLMLTMAIGCGSSEGPAQQPPEAEAARVFKLAQDLEQEGQTRKAFAGYHQIVRLYPDTAEGRSAARRIGQAQQESLRKGGARKAMSSRS